VRGRAGAGALAGATLLLGLSALLYVLRYVIEDGGF
jgi:hypothetical protein